MILMPLYTSDNFQGTSGPQNRIFGPKLGGKNNYFRRFEWHSQPNMYQITLNGYYTPPN